MKRTLLVAGLAIAVLLGASLVLVLSWTEGARPAPRMQAKVAAEPVTAPSAPPAEAPSAPRAAPWLAAPARPTSTAQAWRGEAVDASAPAMADPVIRKAVRRALLATPVEAQLARCVERDREFGFGGVASPERTPRAKPAVLLLDLETMGGGQIKIADARVQSWGGASQEAVTCARHVLIGKVVAGGNGKAAGGLLQMSFTLNPRSPVLAAIR